MTEMTEAQKLIRDTLRRHSPGPCGCGTCIAIWTENAASEIDKALGGLGRHWLVRHESGGGRTFDTEEQARSALENFVYRPPSLEDEGSGRYTGVESRWMSPWSEAQ